MSTVEHVMDYQRSPLPRAAQVSYWSWWLVAFPLAWAALYFTVAQQPIELLKSNSFFILVGFGAAFLGNISAIGGGIIFIPVMIFICHVPPVDALKIALASQCFGMTSGAIGWLQQKVVPVRALWMTVPGLLIGSSISSLWIHPNALLVKGLFGPVSILLGVLTIISFMRQPRQERSDIPSEAWLPVFLIATLGGLITGWVAIGEGELVAALLMLRYGLSARASIGLGVLLLAVDSFYLTGINSLTGTIPWNIAAFTGLGCVFGARLAPIVGQYVNQSMLKVAFAAIAIGDGALFMYQFLR